MSGRRGRSVKSISYRGAGCIVVQQAKPPPATLKAHIGAMTGVLDAPFVIQLHANVPGKVAEDDPCHQQSWYFLPFGAEIGESISGRSLISHSQLSYMTRLYICHLSALEIMLHVSRGPHRSQG